jgi:hypothetical protein
VVEVDGGVPDLFSIEVWGGTVLEAIYLKTYKLGGSSLQ